MFSVVTMSRKMQQCMLSKENQHSNVTIKKMHEAKIPIPHVQHTCGIKHGILCKIKARFEFKNKPVINAYIRY